MSADALASVDASRMGLPSFTVITPALNAARTIQQTIDSVAAQGYPGEVDHVVVDGGSTDGTVDIVRRAGVRYISEPDRGLSHALNKGLALARNELFAELNADDFYAPGALLEVGRAFAAHPEIEWVTGRCAIVDGDGREIRRLVTGYKSILLKRWSYALHLAHNFVAAPATFVRASALREIGGFDEQYCSAMDYDVWLRLGERGAPLVLDQQLAAFRMAGNTISLSGFDTQFREHALIAQRNGRGHPLAVAANRLASRGIVCAYAVCRATGAVRGRR